MILSAKWHHLEWIEIIHVISVSLDISKVSVELSQVARLNYYLAWWVHKVENWIVIMFFKKMILIVI